MNRALYSLFRKSAVQCLARVRFPPKNTLFVTKHVTSHKYVPSSCYSGYISLDNSEYLDEDTSFMDLVEEHELKPNSEFMKNVLYPDSDDEVVNRLKQCGTMKEVLAIIDEGSVTSVPQICQSILMLRYTHKYSELRLYFDVKKVENDIKREELVLNSSFQKLLSLTEKNYENMDVEEMSCCAAYLNKMGIPIEDPFMMKLITKCEDYIHSLPPDFVSLGALSRLCIAIRAYPSVWSVFTLRRFIPIITERLDSCETCDDLRYITICLQKMALMINETLLNTYKEKCSILMEKRNNPEEELARIRSILKSVTFLFHNVFNGSNTSTVRGMLTSLSGSVHLLSFTELISLYKRAYPLQEPASLLKEIADVGAKWISDHKGKGTEDNIHLVMLRISSMTLCTDEVAKSAERYVKKYLQERPDLCPFSSLNSAYYVLKNINSKNKELYHLYWCKIAKLIGEYNAIQYYDLGWLCRRYMILVLQGENVRCIPFEKSVVSASLNHINQTEISYRPYIYAKLASLLVAFGGDDLDQKFMRETIDKLAENLLRLNVIDILVPSTALAFGVYARKNNHMLSAMFIHYYVKLIEAVNANNIKILEFRSDLKPQEMNALLLCYSQRKGTKGSHLFHKMVERYKYFKAEEIDSRIIRDAISNFIQLRHIVPEFAEQCAEYCHANENVIHGSVIALLLAYFYTFGFVPRELPPFLDTCIKMLNRDREELSSSKILRSALALCFFNYLPPELAEYIFDVDFLQRVEKETKTYKGISSSRAKSDFMELNRTVCLDYPEYGVPWFHHDFYDNHDNAGGSGMYWAFHSDVLKHLQNLVQDEKIVQVNHCSPYNHRIDFLVCLKKDGTPVDADMRDDPSVTKVALLLDNSGIPASGYYPGKGKKELNTRQLEILNYKVIPITYKFWNSMYMSEPSAKQSHLQSQIWNTAGN